MAVEEKLKLNIGSSVKMMKSTYGWGGLSAGAEGIITEQVDPRTYYATFPNMIGRWLVDVNDVLVIPSKILDDNDDALNVLTRSVVEKYSSFQINRVRLLKHEKNKLLSEISVMSNGIRDNFNQMNALDKIINSDVRKTKLIIKSVDLPMYVKSLLEHCYDSIVIEGALIKATTKPILINYDIHKNIPVGVFIVSISPTEIKIVSTSKPQPATLGYPHPHISGETICWGTWSQEIHQLHTTHEYMYLLSKIYAYLNDVNQAGWYKDVRLWLKDIDKRCTRCYAKLDSCTCHLPVCSHCGIRISQCRCWRCPVDDEEFGENYDNFCRYECISFNGEKNTCNTMEAYVNAKYLWSLPVGAEFHITPPEKPDMLGKMNFFKAVEERYREGNNRRRSSPTLPTGGITVQVVDTTQEEREEDEGESVD